MDNNKRLSTFEPKFPRENPSYQVFFTWEITYACNYHCSYCHAPKPWNPDVRKTTCLEVKEWIRIWNNIYEDYGTCFILISGGEPFVYPSFMDLIIGLHKKHILELCTNLEWDIEFFIKNVDPRRVKVGTSFHPEFSDLNKFLQRLKLLKDSDFRTHVNFVPWPPLLDKMAEYKEKVEKIGVQFILQPFIGEFEERKYPQGYTDSEKEYFKIFKDDCNISTLNFKTTRESNKKGKLCRMGQNYAFIHPDGKVERCCKDHSIKLGNIIDGTFRLLEEPVPCSIDECNCWRCMLVETEPEWVEHWGWRELDEIAPPYRSLEISEREISGTVTKKARDMKVALVQPPPWGIYDPPVSLAQLSACLKQKGYKVSVFDTNIYLYNNRKEEYKTVWAIEQSSFWNNRDNVSKFFKDNSQDVDEIIKRIISFEPDVVGFSVNISSLDSTLIMAERLKSEKPKIKIILGGPLFLVPGDIESILGNDCIDVIVIGEGEETFCELVEILQHDQDINDCKALCFKKNGHIVKTEPRPLMKNLDELPFLDFADLPLDSYDLPGHLGRHISLMTSRGCIHNCVFCGPKGYWPGYRAMSGRRIYEEIKYHIQQNPEIEHIEFLDLLFNGNMKTLDEFCDLIISNPPRDNLKWHANLIVRPEMTLEILTKMKRAGCDHVTYGIESGSQRVLDLMRKRYRIEDADKVLEYTHEARIKATCNFMFGFPGETEEDFQQTLEFLRRNKDYLDVAYPSRAFCTIEPHSYMEKHLDKFEIISNPNHGQYWESEDGKNTYPERMRRCETFSSFAQSLGISVGSGLQTSLELDRWYNLGFYYESKKDHKNAVRCFSKYVELDHKNENIINRLKKNKDCVKSIEVLQRCDDINTVQIDSKVSFNWDIQWICNYRCPYCWFFDRWAELKNQNRYFSVNQLMKFWKNIYTKYGSVKIAITGGEPFLYPNFSDFIKELSQIHTIEIITNLSTEIEAFVKKVNSNNVKVNPSFHPLFADFDKFIDKVQFLKENGLMQCVSYVAWPPQICKIGYYIEKFNQYGISISIQSFFGEYRGIRYPDGYNDEEKQIILPHIGERGGEPFQTEPLKTKGKLCAAGHRYGVLHPDGTVLRCGGINPQEPASIVGNIFNENFKLLENSLPCTSEICPCNEWAFLLVKESKETAKKIYISRSSIPPYCVFFTWYLNNECNYKCSYCKPQDIKTASVDIYKWIKVWDGLYDKHGSCHIHISGGEPFLYLNFIELITRLSKKHTLEFSTNLSTDILSFIQNISPQRARLGGSFHPEFADLEDFLKKIVLLKENGFEVWISYVAYPPHLMNMAGYKRKVEERGIQFSILPFNGEFEGRQYPQNYTEDEKRLLTVDDSNNVNRETINWRTDKDKSFTKGRLCRMGQMYARIYPDAEVYRCCGNGALRLGNLLDGTFRLVEEPMPCECDNCPCWRCMLVDKEEHWLTYWAIPGRRNLERKEHND